MGPTPGAEAPLTPDEADVLDAGDVVEGLCGARLVSTSSGCLMISSSDGLVA